VLATYFDESGPGCGTGGPSKVGLKPGGASWIGALDMAGNVAEWVADFYRADLYAERSGDSVVDPLQREPAAGLDAHVIRGGSFRDGNAPLRSFTRAFATTGAGTDAIGVRCCVSLDDATGATPGDGGVGAP
jgi:serine/threonine-protein kinase